MPDETDNPSGSASILAIENKVVCHGDRARALNCTAWHHVRSWTNKRPLVGVILGAVKVCCFIKPFGSFYLPMKNLE